MAHFQITPLTTGLYHARDISSTSAEKTASLLQRNFESFHVFWNFKGYHNHQVHYLLTAYALGANPDQLQTAFDKNADYQRQRLPIDEGLIQKLSDERYFKSLLGNDTYFGDYTAFFQRKFEEDGWQNVVEKYLFSRSEIAEEILVGLFAGVIHPLIHFGFGIEFEQPAVIAEGLAQGVCHNKFFGPYLRDSERLANESRHDKGSSLLDLMQEIRDDPTLYDEQYWDGGDSLNDKILADAPKSLCEIAAKWKVAVEDLDEKTAEMIEANVYVTGAAQFPGKEIKLDFFFMHSVNASIFFSALNRQAWLSGENKARLLEWKGRSDLLTYASRLAPKLYLDEIFDYKPRQEGMTWESLIQRTNQIQHDDGHVAKLIRALAHGSRVCAPYQARPELSARFPLNEVAYLQIANMAIDTTTNPRLPDRWVRGAGGARNWGKYAARVNYDRENGIKKGCPKGSK